MPKPPGRACQEGGMHPSPVWVSALFDDGGLFLVMDAGWLMVALLVLSIWLADLLACLQRFCSVLEPLENYPVCVAEFLHLYC